MVDREMELRHLVAAERHVLDAHVRIARLGALIDYAAAMGQPTTTAREMLASMRDVLVSFVAHRDAIARALKGMPAGAP